MAQRAFHIPFQITLDRTGTEFRLVGTIGNGVQRLVGQCELQILTGGAFSESLEFQFHNVLDLRLR